MKHGFLKFSMLLGGLFMLSSFSHADFCSSFVDSLNTQYHQPPLSTGMGSGWVSACEVGTSSATIAGAYQQAYGSNASHAQCSALVDGLNLRFGLPSLTTGVGSGWVSLCESGMSSTTITTIYVQAYGTLVMGPETLMN